MKIAILGTGNLGLSIAKGLIFSNAFTSLYLTKRNAEGIKDYEEYSKVKVTSDNREAVQNADILIFFRSANPNGKNTGGDQGSFNRKARDHFYRNRI